MTNEIAALDLYAGAGGWSVACQQLRIPDRGVEIMPAAIRTRGLNGMATVYRDAWNVALAGSFFWNLLIASPPCQKFSMAGSGLARALMAVVIELIRDGTYKDLDKLRAAVARHGVEDIGLVLLPLHYAYVYRPRWIALEQVPPVLPIWQAMGAELATLGYGGWVGYLHSEQYGVPQTRKRAFLLAELGASGMLTAPRPTHSKFHVRNKSKLDPGVEKWVSMAEALGWGMTERPSMTLTGGGTATGGGYEPFGHGGREWMERELGAGRWALRGNQKPQGGRGVTDDEGYQVRSDDEPAQTMTAGSRSFRVVQRKPQSASRLERDGVEPGRTEDEPAYTIMAHDGGYPAGFKLFPDSVLRSNYGTHGDPENRGERLVDEPAPTLTSKANRNKWLRSGQSVNGEGRAAREGDEPALTMTGTARLMQVVDEGDVTGRNLTVEEAAILQSFPPFEDRASREAWMYDRPATTIASSPVLAGPGRSEFVKGGVSRQNRPGSTTLSPNEAAVIQSFPWPATQFWGTRTKQFLQIGNAVPPLLARAVISHLTGRHL